VEQLILGHGVLGFGIKTGYDRGRGVEKNPKSFVCFKCKNPGHFAKDC
jgi:hypothetical protein